MSEKSFFTIMMCSVLSEEAGDGLRLVIVCEAGGHCWYRGLFCGLVFWCAAVFGQAPHCPMREASVKVASELPGLFFFLVTSDL